MPRHSRREITDFKGIFVKRNTSTKGFIFINKLYNSRL
nr:MAG TPA: hypothetical protein [Caudoviricetes sp.]